MLFAEADHSKDAVRTVKEYQSSDKFRDVSAMHADHNCCAMDPVE